MQLHNFNTVVLKLDDHEAWCLIEVLKQHPDYHKPENSNFGKFAKELAEKIEPLRVKK